MRTSTPIPTGQLTSKFQRTQYFRAILRTTRRRGGAFVAKIQYFITFSSLRLYYKHGAGIYLVVTCRTDVSVIRHTLYKPPSSRPSYTLSKPENNRDEGI